jgi:hypothetical protein
MSAETPRQAGWRSAGPARFCVFSRHSSLAYGRRIVGLCLPAEYNPRAPSSLPAVGAHEYQGGHVSTAKEELTRLIQDQPEDSSAEEIVRELAFHVMVERGLADSDARRIVSDEETARRIRSWRS